MERLCGDGNSSRVLSASSQEIVAVNVPPVVTAHPSIDIPLEQRIYSMVCFGVHIARHETRELTPHSVNTLSSSELGVPGWSARLARELHSFVGHFSTHQYAFPISFGYLTICLCAVCEYDCPFDAVVEDAGQQA